MSTPKRAPDHADSTNADRPAHSGADWAQRSPGPRRTPRCPSDPDATEGEGHPSFPDDQLAQNVQLSAERSRTEPCATTKPRSLIRAHTVDDQIRTDDGRAVRVRIDGRAGRRRQRRACHGFGMSSASWCFQRAVLSRTARGRLLGQRGPAAPGTARGIASIERLGRDLRAVLDHCAPEGPVVLARPSMGGMTIMALRPNTPNCSARSARRGPGRYLADPVGIPSLSLLPGAAAYRGCAQAATALDGHPVCCSAARQGLVAPRVDQTAGVRPRRCPIGPRPGGRR